MRNEKHMCKAARIVVFCVCIIAFGLIVPSSNATIRIGGESLRANGLLTQGFQYTGPCPVELQFGWGVIANQPTSVTYTFSRSDGGHSSRTMGADLPQPSRSYPVYDKWLLGAHKAQFYWLDGLHALPAFPGAKGFIDAA